MSEDVNIVNIDNYIRIDDAHNYPICREERQYALYLSNVLRYYGKNPDYDETHKDVPANRIGDNEKVKNIFKACGFNNLDNLIIENVYYEATFMRDFFERNRRYYLAKDRTLPEVEYSKNPFKHKDYMVSINDSFNYKLLEYCSDIINNTRDNKTQNKTQDQIKKSEDYKIAERNYGGNNNFIGELKFKQSEREKTKLKELNEEGLKILEKINILKVNKEDNPAGFEKWNEFKVRVRAMMNAKPDLAIIYYNSKEKGLRKLLFIECKYCSGEDSYEYNICQREVQGDIAAFLCKHFMRDVKVSEIMMSNKKRKTDNDSKGKNGLYLSRKIKFVIAPADEGESNNGVKDSNKREDESKDTNAGEINIKDLIELEKDIFNK